MTFSIVAIDRENKEVGFAITSCTWDAGMVGTAKAELGSICSQAAGYFPFHSIFYEKIAENFTIEEIFEEFKRVDGNIQDRQVGMVSFNGPPLAFTSDNTGAWSGHKIGDDYACQGNILTGSNVIENMADAFEKSEGMLAERLYAALQAGDDVGGDIRGKMSARVLVRKKGMGLDDIHIDFTIEDHDEPVKEIGRLLAGRRKIYQAYMLQIAVTKADDENRLTAVEEMDTYLSDKVDKTVVDYHSFVADQYLTLGLKDKAIEVYRGVIKISPGLADFFKSEKEEGKMAVEVVDAILSN